MDNWCGFKTDNNMNLWIVMDATGQPLVETRDFGKVFTEPIEVAGRTKWPLDPEGEPLHHPTHDSTFFSRNTHRPDVLLSTPS